jgi:hypothetical protein
MDAYLLNLAKAICAVAPEKRTPWFLRPQRYSRRVGLALFMGKTPDWGSDAYKLIKYVNLLATGKSWCGKFGGARASSLRATRIATS